MLSPDHPNAQLIMSFYGAMAAAMESTSDDTEARTAAFAEIAGKMQQILAPDFIIHTGGVRLATTGDMGFMMLMGKRRNMLSGETFRPVGVPYIVADDHFAFVRAQFVGERDGVPFNEESAGAWRFNAAGQAAEHWELANSPDFDDFFIGSDPDFEFTSAKEFWLKDA